jgi:hypothetical protein
LIATGYLQGGEPVEVRGCMPGEPIQFPLPVCTFALMFDFDGRVMRETPNLETVLIEPNVGRVQLVFRAGIKVDKHLLKLSEVGVYCREYPNRPRGS